MQIAGKMCVEYRGCELLLLLMMISPQLVLGRLLKPIPTPRIKYGNSGHVEGRLMD